ncbi:MAG: glycosyltransferase [Myxococcota bacterium]
MFPSLLAPLRQGSCFGGAEMAALDLLEGLVERQHRLWLIGVEGSFSAGATVQVAPATPAFVPGQRVSLDRWRFPEILAALPGDLDALHAHLNDPGALLALDTYARAHPSTRVISTLHLSAVFPATAEVVRSLLDAGSPVRFVAPSRFAADSYGRPGQIAVIENGVDLTKIPYFEAPEPDRHLAFAGRRAPEKGFEAAVEIARRAGRSLEVAALSPPETPPQPWVVERGRLERAEVPAFLGRAAITLIPSSIAEAHPLVALESLAAGTPVVGFAVGGLPEIVDESSGILVPPGEVEAAAQAVALAERLSRAACRARAEARFGRRSMIERYERLYRGA